jgi:hypothetical protein
LSQRCWIGVRISESVGTAHGGIDRRPRSLTDPLFAADTPLRDVVVRVGGAEATPPLYFLLAWVWSQVFGVGEVGLRVLSAVTGVVTVALVIAATQRLLHHRAQTHLHLDRWGGDVKVRAVAACPPLRQSTARRRHCRLRLPGR